MLTRAGPHVSLGSSVDVVFPAPTLPSGGTFIISGVYGLLGEWVVTPGGRLEL